MLIDINNPPHKYAVIYADAPWAFKTHSDKGMARSAEQHYDCMDLDAIKRLPVANLAADNCVLFSWVTDPYLEKSFEVMHAWGFQYKTVGFTWVKTNAKSAGFFTGMGYYTRSNPEMCLIGTRGRSTRLNKDVRQLVVSPRREHSRKPDEMYGHIERLFAGPYVELFARTCAPGWDAWGNHAGKFELTATP